MRQIKFKGLGYDNKWYFGNYYNIGDKHFIQTAIESIEINPLTICQFTEIQDKNRKDIYECDIVYIAGEGKVLIKFPFFDLYERIYCGDSDDIENVIGNIHENPELLNEI